MVLPVLCQLQAGRNTFDTAHDNLHIWERSLQPADSGPKTLHSNSCVQLKGTLPQNMFILKTGRIGHINSLNIGGLKEIF